MKKLLFSLVSICLLTGCVTSHKSVYEKQFKYGLLKKKQQIPYFRPGIY